MARKPKSNSSSSSAKSSPKASSSDSSAVANDGDLGLSDLRLRLNFLEKENEKLIKQIETNRKKLDKFNESINEVGVQIAERIAPLRQKILELDEQIHELFAEIFAGRKLGKKSLRDIKCVYYNLQIQGMISRRELPEGFMNISDLLSGLFDDFEDSEEFNQFKQKNRGAEETAEGFAPDISKPDREEQKKIRQLFLRLADRFHPDKVTDETEKAFRTEIMKEINTAYQNADLATLLAIEKQQELEMRIDRDSSDDLTRHCAKVESENTFLKNQLDEIKRKLKLTKKSEQGEITATFQKIAKYGGDPIGEALEEVKVHVETVEAVYEFVRDFRDRRITIKDFLKGPKIALGEEDSMTEEELMMEFLSQFR